MPIARARFLGLAALVCLAFFVAVDATGLGRSDAIAALRQRSRQQQKASIIGEVGAGIAGVSLLSKIGEKIGKLVTDHKTQAHGKELAAQIRASKKLWCDILGLQVEAEAGRFAQAASIIKTAPNPKLSKMALRDGTPAMKILPFQNYYSELQTFAYRIASSKRWIKKTLIPMCPALKTKPDEPAAGEAKAAGDAANQPDVKADADGPDPGSRLYHIFKVYDESLLIIATKMAELQAIIKAPPAAPAVPGVAGAAAKSPSPKELDDEAKTIVGEIGAKLETLAKSFANGAAKDLAQDMTVNALAQLGAGVVADSVVPVVGVASTGTSLFAMGSTIADYNTEWARDEANKEEFLTDARYAACNMLLALFRESCKFPVSDLLFSYFKASDAQKSQELVKIWRSSPFQLLSAYTNLNCPLLHKIKFEAGWDQVYAKSAAAIQEPSSTQVGQIADLFPAFLPIFKAAHQVTDDTQALADVETFEKGQDPKRGYPLMLNTEGQRVGLRAEFLPLLGKIPFGVVKKDQSGLQVPDNTPITGVEFIAHDSAQKPSAAGGLYDDRRPGKGLHDTDKTKKHQAQLKEKGFLAKAIPLTDDKGGHDRTATEIHVRRSTAGIPIRTIYLIHNAKGTKSDTLTTKQEEYLNSKLYIRSHDDMTAVLRKKENAAVGGLGVVFHAFQQHDYFYFCAEKDATLYWDQELKTLVTASRRRVF